MAELLRQNKKIKVTKYTLPFKAYLSTLIIIKLPMSVIFTVIKLVIVIYRF